MKEQLGSQPEEERSFTERFYGGAEHSYLRVLDLVGFRKTGEAIDDVPIVFDGDTILSEEGTIELENTNDDGSIKRNYTRIAKTVGIGASALAAGTIVLRIVKKKKGEL